MYSQDQGNNLHLRGDELVWRAVKTEQRLIKRTCCSTEQRIGHVTVVDEEENEKRRLIKRVAGDPNTKIAIRRGDLGQFVLLLDLCSIFISTTVRYHTDNKNINKKIKRRNLGFILKPHALNLGGGQ